MKKQTKTISTLGWGCRFTYVCLVFMGYAICYACRVDMSIAIVAMVNRSKFVNCNLVQSAFLKKILHFHAASGINSSEIEQECTSLNSGETGENDTVVDVISFILFSTA
jgi:hypothetical protein